MPANTAPVFTVSPRVDHLKMTGNVASAKSDGTGTIATDIFLLAAGATNGTLVSRLRICLYATTPTTTTATVYRFFLSTQSSGSTTADNTHLINEVTVGAMAAANATTGLPSIEIPLNYVIPSGQYLLVSVHANYAANTGAQIQMIGGDF